MKHKAWKYYVHFSPSLRTPVVCAWCDLFLPLWLCDFIILLGRRPIGVRLSLHYASLTDYAQPFINMRMHIRTAPSNIRTRPNDINCTRCERALLASWLTTPPISRSEICHPRNISRARSRWAAMVFFFCIAILGAVLAIGSSWTYPYIWCIVNWPHCSHLNVDLLVYSILRTSSK